MPVETEFLTHMLGQLRDAIRRDGVFSVIRKAPRFGQQIIIQIVAPVHKMGPGD